MMSSVPQDDIDVGARSTSTPGTPMSRLRRQQSEPSHIPSNPVSETHFLVKCIWCGEDFDNSDATLPTAKLRQHMRDVHPNITKSSLEKVANGQLLAPESDQGSQTTQTFDGEKTISIEDAISSNWPMHDVRNFSSDYEGNDSGLESTWKSAFDGFERPKAYESNSVTPGGFLPITEPSLYVDILKDPQSHSTKELYAITANVAQALKVWQDEYLVIDKIIKRATRSSLKKTANPREPEDPQVYEDKKEAMLYGYKHDPKPNQIGCQDPFVQGGFVPTAEQMRKLRLSGIEPWKADGWKPAIVDGVECVPKLRPPAPPKPRRKPTNVTSKHVDKDGKIQPEPKRVTRYRGSKHPLTRETSHVQTAPPSPSLGANTPSGSRQVSVTPQRTAQTPVRKSGRTLGQSLSGLTESKLVSTVAKSIHPKTPKSPAVASATAPTSAPTSQASTPVYPDPLLDPKNQLKIQQSKHPKRTEAMILHWAKFNLEGRTRNPKRTKAQIEAAKAESEREASLGPKGPSERKRKHDSKVGSEGPTSAPKKAKQEAKTEPGTPVSERAGPTVFRSVNQPPLE